MRIKPMAREFAQWVGFTILALLTTVGLGLAHAHSTTAGMVFLVVVVVTATQAGLIVSLYSALLCALSFDYFFLLRLTP
jgi:K+-sensing histidine kinase KdpD